MDPTVQKADAAAKPDVSSGQATAKADAQTVPLGEHIELRQRLRAAEEENAKLKGLAEKKEAPAPAASVPAAPVDPVRALQLREQVRDVAEELGVNKKQAQAIVDVMNSTPGTNAVEAKAIAAMRNADLFKGSDDGFQAGIHGAARPGVATPALPKPEVDPIEDRLKKILAMPSKGRQDAYFNNLVGAMAAEDVGKSGHQLLPL